MSSQVANQDARPFLGDLSVLDLKTEYRSLKEDPVREFYRPCLLNAISYKRAVGYFRSTVYNVIGTSIVEFARRGGRTELICSPELSEEDIDSIALGYARKSEVVGDRLSQQIEDLLSAEETAFNTRVLATLVSVGALEIKVAVRADRKGLYHEKIGVFFGRHRQRRQLQGLGQRNLERMAPTGQLRIDRSVLQLARRAGGGAGQ